MYRNTSSINNIKSTDMLIYKIENKNYIVVCTKISYEEKKREKSSANFWSLSVRSSAIDQNTENILEPLWYNFGCLSFRFLLISATNWQNCTIFPSRP